MAEFTRKDNTSYCVKSSFNGEIVWNPRTTKMSESTETECDTLPTFYLVKEVC